MVDSAAVEDLTDSPGFSNPSRKQKRDCTAVRRLERSQIIPALNSPQGKCNQLGHDPTPNPPHTDIVFLGSPGLRQEFSTTTGNMHPFFCSIPCRTGLITKAGARRTDAPRSTSIRLFEASPLGAGGWGSGACTAKQTSNPQLRGSAGRPL